MQDKSPATNFLRLRRCFRLLVRDVVEASEKFVKNLEVRSSFFNFISTLCRLSSPRSVGDTCDSDDDDDEGGLELAAESISSLGRAAAAAAGAFRS